MSNKFIFVLFLIFITLYSVNANGLQISNNSIIINKTAGQDYSINLTISNQQPDNMVNITFAPNSEISMSPISLASGANTTVIANIIAANSFQGNIALKGWYLSNLGTQNLLHNLTVDYTNGLSVCDFSIVQGDSVRWTSSVPSDTQMINADSGSIVTTISNNNSYNSLFDQPVTFNYYFTRYGLRFTDVCTITVLSTTGYINNPTFDAQLLLDVTVNFPSTNVSANIQSDSYTVSVGSSSQDIFSIKNNGNNTAKNISISAQWFNFTTNNFDLAPGQSKNIGYTIFPIIGSSSQTNQTYFMLLNITGNFNTISHNFSIFVPYSLVTTNGTDNSASLSELAKERIQFAVAYCRENPEFTNCAQLLQGLGGTNNTLDQNSFLNQLAKAIIDSIDSNNKFQNELKTYETNTSDTISTISGSVITLNQSVGDLNTKSGSQDDLINAMSAIVLFVMIGGSMIFGIVYFKRRNRRIKYGELR